MFRKKCKRCNSAVSKSFEFCPRCGQNLRGNKKFDKKDYGMLGKDDEFDNMFQEPMPGFGNSMLNKMLAKATRMLEKEIENMHKLESKNNPRIRSRRNFQLYINGKRVNIPEMENMQTIPQNIKASPNNRAKFPIPSEETIKKAAGLPRKEAQTSLKRLANKIIYELDAPGVRSISKILINKTEDGIEVRIFTRNAVLCKNIAIKLPLIAYYLKKQKLFLEFQNK